MSTESENKAIIDAARRYGEVELIGIGSAEAPVDIASVPEGRKLENIKPYLDKYLKAPERKTGTATFTTPDSFIGHINRTKDTDSVVFVDDNPAGPSMLAVYDYNRTGGEGAPRFGDHRAKYSFPLSDEWKAWKKVQESPLEMAAFAEFLEDRIVDVILPAEAQDRVKEFAVNLGLTLATPQQLMTLSRGLKVNVESQVASAQNLSSGEAQISFSEKHKDEGGGDLRVPGGFAISIPVFRGDAAYHVPVRLRYRVAGGRVLWFVSLHGVDALFSDAIELAREKVAKETSLPTFFGSPEASR